VKRTIEAYEVRRSHEREAARLRWLAANATAKAVKARLLDKAEEHERLAHPLAELDAEGLAVLAQT